MNIHHLRYAKAVGDVGSFSGAAKACHVSQPSLSNAVAQIEQELGDALFIRSTRKVSLTPFGEYVLPLIEEAVKAVEEVHAGAKRHHGNGQAVIRMGLSPLVNARLLKQVIEPFERKLPEVNIIFKECMLDDMDERIAARRLDVSCVLQGSSTSTSKTLPLYKEALFYLPAHASKLDGKPIRLGDLSTDVFVTTMDGCGLSDAIRKLFKQKRVRFNEYPGHALSYEVVQEWVSLGIGSGILPDSKVTHQRRIARPIVQNSGEPIEVKYELRWSAAKRLPEHLRQFIEHFRKVVPALVRSGTARLL